MPHKQSRAAGEPVRVLYMSYDGMSDPLGGSQVLPYLVGLAGRGHEIDLISFEKPERSKDELASVEKQCADAGIRWHPLRYHKRPPVLSAVYDVFRMRQLAERLHRERHFNLAHCRSYLSALVGLRLKRRFGLPFIFDMRGFWADERVDGRIWNLANPLFRRVYRYFKRREAEFLADADSVVSLTERGRDILIDRRVDAKAGPPITVIPCCTDFTIFSPVRPADRTAARKALEIPDQARVAAYLGSFGTWYLVEEMMDFFRVQLERDPDARFLVVSREPGEQIKACAEARGVPSEKVIVRPASRAEVPRLLAAADYGLFFIKPVFSKAASSPTKMGEFLGLELPIVTNAGVGDVDRIMEETGAGVLVTSFTDDAYRSALDELENLHFDLKRWWSATRRWFDLDLGLQRYDEIYRRFGHGPVGSNKRFR